MGWKPQTEAAGLPGGGLAVVRAGRRRPSAVMRAVTADPPFRGVHRFAGLQGGRRLGHAQRSRDNIPGTRHPPPPASVARSALRSWGERREAFCKRGPWPLTASTSLGKSQRPSKRACHLRPRLTGLRPSPRAFGPSGIQRLPREAPGSTSGHLGRAEAPSCLDGGGAYKQAERGKRILFLYGGGKKSKQGLLSERSPFLNVPPAATAEVPITKY